MNHLLTYRFGFVFTVINCSALVPPPNAVISPSSCLSRSTYGQTCRFSCQRGDVLEGTSLRVCGNDGQWTGNNDTLCRGNIRRMYIYFNSPFPSCLVPRFQIKAKSTPFIWKWVLSACEWNSFSEEQLNAQRLHLEKRYKTTRKWPRDWKVS